MNKVRLYAVTNGTTRLVKAANQAQALRHVARATFKVEVASAIDVADLVAAGVKVEDATHEPAEQE